MWGEICKVIHSLMRLMYNNYSLIKKQLNDVNARDAKERMINPNCWGRIKQNKKEEKQRKALSLNLRLSSREKRQYN